MFATVLLALSTSGTSASMVQKQLARVSVPAGGVYLGAYVRAPRWVDSARAVETFEAAIGRRLSIENQFYGWNQSFPTQLQRADLVSGRIPMITWKAPSLDEINSGSQDALIASRAADVRRFGAPIFIRWGWEMNGYWMEWAGLHNNSPGRHDGPAKYIQAWRRIHDLFQREGATNVSWVWAPNDESIPRLAWNRIGAYYPGDRYVDWVGLSAYNWGDMRAWSHWSSFATLVSGVYALYSDRKPIMVAETGSTTVGGNQARWIDSLGTSLRKRYRRIKAVLWFEHPPAWTVRSLARSLSAFRSLVATELFRPTN